MKLKILFFNYIQDGKSDYVTGGFFDVIEYETKKLLKI